MLMTDPRMPLKRTQLIPVIRSMVRCPRMGVELSPLKLGGKQSKSLVCCSIRKQLWLHSLDSLRLDLQQFSMELL